MVTQGATITDTTMNAIINKIQAECSRRSISAYTTDVANDQEMKAEPGVGEWWWIEIDMGGIVSVECYCESDGGIETHSGCSGHCLDIPSGPSQGGEIFATDVTAWNTSIDLHDAACACDGYGCVETGGGSTYCGCNYFVTYCVNCGCNNNCTCQELYCTCDTDPAGCYYDYSDCWPTCVCQSQCSCLTNCTCVTDCTCDSQCSCDLVCPCEFDET